MKLTQNMIYYIGLALKEVDEDITPHIIKKLEALEGQEDVLSRAFRLAADDAFYVEVEDE